MSEAPTISTHVLDTQLGEPARGVVVDLYRRLGEVEERVGGGTTDDDGRIARLLDGELQPGTYQISFGLDGPFFRRASLTFVVSDVSRSYHMPMLIAPYSLASYRGS